MQSVEEEEGRALFCVVSGWGAPDGNSCACRDSSGIVVGFCWGKFGGAGGLQVLL